MILPSVRDYRILWTLLLAVGCGCSRFDQAPLHERQKTVTVAHVAGAPLRVEAGTGSITVAKSDRADVQIVGDLRAISEERLEAAEIIASRGDDETLFVRVEWPDGRPLNREGCSFEILIQEAVGVILTSANGELHASDLAGAADLRTVNGSIHVERHAGPIEAHSVNGAVNVSGAAGAVKATTTNGTLGIALAPESIGPVDAHALNGAIDLMVGPSFAGKLSLETTNGMVIADESVAAHVVHSDRHHALLAFGTGEQQSSAATVNGLVRVSALGDKSDGEQL